MKLLVGGSSRLPAHVLGAVLALAMALSGCGGESKADDAAAPGDTSKQEAATSGEKAAGSTASTAKGAGTRASGSSGGGDASTAAAEASKPSASGQASGEAKAQQKENLSTRTLKIEAELKESCVRPGGTQSIVVRTLPSAGVGFDTQYSDYLTGLMEGHYGGNAAGFTDEDGTWSATWVIAPNAPAGLTIVLVLGSHETGGIGETRAEFTMADALGKCA